MIYPNNNYYYVSEGKGKLFLKGLDICAYQEGVAEINQYNPRSCLNIYGFLSRRSNPFLKYQATLYSRMYCID
jgi:hypothetical protein